MNMRHAIPANVLKNAKALGVSIPRLDYFDAFLANLVTTKAHDFIAYRVLRRGELIFDGYYGKHFQGGRRLRTDDIFITQSVTKPFTATCLAILQEDGLVDFWDKVQDHIPEFVGEGKDEVCLWHLLTHTSGLAVDFNDDYLNSYIENEFGVVLPEHKGNDEARLAVYLDVCEKLGLPRDDAWGSVYNMFGTIALRAPLETKPRTGFSYNSFGYVMIGRIIEQISGMTLEEFMQKRIFQPLEMHDSHFVLPREKWYRYVTRNPAHRGADWMNSDDAKTSMHPAGGLKMTMEDLTRFGQMFLQNGTLDGARILSPASVQLMTRDHNSKLPDSYWRGRWLGSNWGFGWDVKNGKFDDLGMLRSERSYNHTGYGGSRLLVDPDNELVAAFYMVEHGEKDACLNNATATNVLYSALDTL